MAGKTFLVSNRNKGIRNLLFLMSALIFCTSLYQFAQVYLDNVVEKEVISKFDHTLIDDSLNNTSAGGNPISEMTLEQLMDIPISNHDEIGEIEILEGVKTPISSNSKSYILATPNQLEE